MTTSPLNFENIVIVLVEPRSAGNIGSTVRAMTNMGFSDLRLVNPREPHTDEQAKRLAHGCGEQLAATKVFSTLEEALADCTTVVATSHKPKRYKQESCSARELGHKIAPFTEKNKVAILFGPENHGLSNDEVKGCPWLVNIPAARDYPSLNLSQSVLVICYELFLSTVKAEESFPELVGQKQMETFYQRVLEIIDKAGFRHKNNDSSIFMRCLRRIFGRTGLDPQELKVLYKLFSQFEYLRRKED